MKKSKVIAIILAAIMILSIGAMSAYFTDGDTATNTFTVGKVSIDLQEPNWTEPTDITPAQEFKKDPQIVNDGINSAYVFMEVVVPYATVVTANADGTKNAEAITDLFSYTVNEGWVQVGTDPIRVADKDADGNELTTGTSTYLYAYAKDGSMTELEAGTETPALFNTIKFANVVEDEGLEGATKNVVVNAYAIQTNNITDATNDGVNTSIVSPDQVWQVLSKQAPSTNVSETENAVTDAKTPVAP